MGKITIYKIANKARLAPKTVSRVINNEPSLSIRTYERVAKIINENNYLPNLSAQRLSTNRLKFIHKKRKHKLIDVTWPDFSEYKKRILINNQMMFLRLI